MEKGQQSSKKCATEQAELMMAPATASATVVSPLSAMKAEDLRHRMELILQRLERLERLNNPPSSTAIDAVGQLPPRRDR